MPGGDMIQSARIRNIKLIINMMQSICIDFLNIFMIFSSCIHFLTNQIAKKKIASISIPHKIKSHQEYWLQEYDPHHPQNEYTSIQSNERFPQQVIAAHIPVIRRTRNIFQRIFRIDILDMDNYLIKLIRYY